MICCGNATAGGAGKTTVALDLGQRLANRGVGVHFLLRGYGGHLKGPARVDPRAHDSQAVGDEALLLAAERPAWISADRAAGARAVVAGGAQCIVMDDGLQNPTLEKDLSLLIIDGTYGFGNGRIIPAGPLREMPEAAAARCRAAVLIGEDECGAAGPAAAPPAGAAGAAGAGAGGRRLLAGQPVYAFCGIGNPTQILRHPAGGRGGAGRADALRRPLPLDDGDMRDTAGRGRDRLRAIPVTTRKDFVRIPPAFRSRVTVVTIRLDWEEPAAIEGLLDPLAQRVPVPA